MAHKAHVKEAMLSTNRKDWEIQIMALHARREALVHHTAEMAGTKVYCDLQKLYLLFEKLIFLDADELEMMEDLPESYQMWLDVRARMKDKARTIEARLGPSSGVKFQLENSWTGKTNIVCLKNVQCVQK
jgi:hypothetical protein